MSKPAFPDVLKKANWDKQKGVIAKISKGETGIGAGLDELFNAYNVVPWDTLDDKLAETAKTPEEGKKIFSTGHATLNGPIETFRKKCIDFSRAATKAAEGFKSPLLKGPKDYLGKMSLGAINFSAICRDTSIETLKKFEVIEKTLLDEAVTIAKVVKARQDAAQKIAAELVAVRKDEAQVKIAFDHASEMMKNITAGKGAAGPTAAEIRKAATGVEDLLKKVQIRYKALQSDPVIVFARGGTSPGTAIAKAVAIQAGTVWTKGSSDFVAINQSITAMEQAHTSLETLADKAELAAGTSTKTDEDFIKIAKAAVISLASLQKDIALAHERAKECPQKMKELLEANKKGTLDAAATKKNGKVRLDDGNKRVGQIEEFLKTVENDIHRFAGFPDKLKSDTNIKAAIDKADGLKTYAGTCIASGKTSMAQAQKTLDLINALK